MGGNYFKIILLAILLAPMQVFGQAFVTTWKTDNPGVSADNQITIPTAPGRPYKYTVRWGDGSSDNNVRGEITHTYATPGTYSVEITGDFPRIRFLIAGDNKKLLSIDAWGDIEWAKMDSAFFRCSNLTYAATDTPDLSDVTTMVRMFQSATNFDGDLTGWDVSAVQDMSYAFASTSFFEGDGLSGWKVSNVTNMEGLFQNSVVFAADLSGWDVTNVTNMSEMFFRVQEVVGIEDWKVGSVTNMSSMFQAIEDFDSDISGWDVSSVTDMSEMFFECEDFNRDISGWEVGNVTKMTRMFSGAASFNVDLSDWDVSRVRSMNGIFRDAAAFDQNLSDWNFISVEFMNNSFDDSGLSKENYEKLLTSWALAPALRLNVNVGAENIEYCRAGASKMILMNDYLWTFTGDVERCFSGKSVLTFEMPEQVGSTILSFSANTVQVNVPIGTDLTSLTPTFSISAFATVVPESGTAQNFETPFVYTVTAENGDTQETTVTVNTIAISNNTPTNLTLSGTSIDENNAVNVVIGTLSTIDPDADDSHSYALVSGTGDSDNDAFNISGSSLRATERFDFETKSSYTVRIQTDDGEGGTFPRSFLINVMDVNEAPTDIILSTFIIEENNATNDVIGALTTSDPDPSDTHTYSLVSGTGDSDNDAFNISGGSLRASQVFDFETKSSYSVRLQTNDGSSGTYQEAFTIAIMDDPDDNNAAPTDIALSVTSIDENNTVNAVIGALSTTDADATDSHSYALVSGAGATDNSSFNILGSSLRATSVFDFEAKSSYTVRVQTNDGNGGTFAESFTITINNVDETIPNNAPTDITLSGTSIDENNAMNAVIGTLSTTDADATDSHSYILVSGAGDSDNAAFNISGSSLRATSVFDFEAKSSYTVRVQTNDGNGGTFAESFTITVNDVDETVPNNTPTDIALSGTSIDENNAVNAVIGALSTTDADATDSHSYALVSGTGATDNAAFNISGSSLRATSVFDFETKSSYSVRIQTDDGEGGAFARSFLINVMDVNEAPADIILSTFIIEENNATNDVIGALTTSDPDPSDTHTYSLVSGTGDSDNDAFNISGGSLRASQVFDFETKSSYSVRLQTNDGSSGTYQEAFTIAIMDDPDDNNTAPTDITLLGTTIDENNRVNEVIGTLSTTDADATDSHSYILVSGTGDSDNAAFNISGSSLRATSVFDFETKSSYSIRVQTNDGNGGTFSKSFTITIDDVSETIPNNAPTNITLSGTSIDENNAVNAVIGTLSTTDADATDSHSYALVTGTGDSDNASFNISGGSLRATSSFDFETRSSYAVRVQANDGRGGTFSKSFTITIGDVSEIIPNNAPTNITLSSSALDENNTVNAIIGTLSTTDADASDSHSYTLVSGRGDDDNSSFNISRDRLRATSVFDFETKSRYSVRVQANDGEGGTFSKTFTITIGDVNEAPSEITLSMNQMAENNATNDAVGTFTTTDPDAGDAHTYSLVSGTGATDNASFAIEGTELRGAEVFDFETKSSYSIRVQTDDDAGGTFSKSFIITINDVEETIPNNVPTDVTLSGSSIDENNTLNDVIGMLSVTDPDESDSHSYVLASGTGDTDNTSFAIIGDELVAAEVFDFEMQSSYSVRIEANDGNGGTLAEVFMITIGDLTETIPNNAPTDITLSGGSIEENNTAGDVIGMLSTTDEDANDSHTYILVSGTGDSGNSSFSIIGDELVADEVFDFEAQSSYSVLIQANDGNGGTFDKVFAISITDITEGVLINMLIEDQVLDQGSETITIEVDDVFLNADNDAVIYTASSSDTEVVTVSMLGSALTLTAVDAGSVTITVFADDRSGVISSVEFTVTVDQVVTAIANEITSQVNVYPNPSSAYINIELPDELGWSGAIINLSGQIMTQFTEMKSVTRLNISQWVNGTYYLQLNKDDQSATTKILIQR